MCDGEDALARSDVYRSDLEEITLRRRTNAAFYVSLLDPKVTFSPPCREIEFNTFRTFGIQVEHREALRQHLGHVGIGTAIHYPVPIHVQPAAASMGHREGDFPITERQARRIITLPVHQGLTAVSYTHLTLPTTPYMESPVDSRSPTKYYRTGH